MNILEKFSIRRRLMSALALSTCVLFGFGILAITKMSELGDIAQTMYAQPLQVSNSARETRVNIIKIHLEMKELILSDGEYLIREHIRIIDGIEAVVYKNLDIIKSQASSESVIKLQGEILNLLSVWKNRRQIVIELCLLGSKPEAIAASQNQNNTLIKELESKLESIYKYEGASAESFVTEAKRIESSQKTNIALALFASVIITFLFFALVSRSITRPVETLKNEMNNSIHTGELTHFSLQGNNEIVDMSRYYNTLIEKLKYEFWIKDGQNKLNQELSFNYSVKYLPNSAIQFLARFLEAGNGVFYIANEDEGILELKGAFAYTEGNLSSKTYTIGEGIIGQVALERQPILLKNIKREEAVIISGTTSEPPLSIYAFPLIYEDKLYGVIELSSFEPFTQVKQDFLKEAAQSISINLHSALQREKIKNLLRQSEEANAKIQKSAEELKFANVILKDQQDFLQQQTEELQNTNAELEEQHQILQQQSGELQYTNAQLEEQQQQLEEQSRILNIQNKELEISKDELTNRSNELEAANKYKSEFLANVSHELKTPLNSIILLSRLLLNNRNADLSELNSQKVEIIHKSGNELLRLINDILDLSKIESDKVSLQLTSFHSNDLLKDLSLLFEDIAKEKGVKFTVDDLVNSNLYGDRNKISQVLRNLLSNAIKFTERGSVSFKLIPDKSKSNGVAFIITDTGIGIENDQINRIFEKFQQGDGSISRKYGGTGLGLSISKKMTELLNGHISVQSQIGVGSTFTLYIPYLIDLTNYKNSQELTACTSDFETASTELDANNCFISRNNGIAAPDLQGKKILIVDDDPINSFVLATILEEFNAEVYEVENGSDALRKLINFKVDLILMDIMMPVMDGYEAMKAIRLNKKLKDIPIIALTAKNVEKDSTDCIAAGANAYISKPVNYDLFVQLVKSWISK